MFDLTKTIYEKPQIEAIEVQSAPVMEVSTSDPWAGNGETEW